MDGYTTELQWLQAVGQVVGMHPDQLKLASLMLMALVFLYRKLAAIHATVNGHEIRLSAVERALRPAVVPATAVMALLMLTACGAHLPTRSAMRAALSAPDAPACEGYAKGQAVCAVVAPVAAGVAAGAGACVAAAPLLGPVSAGCAVVAPIAAGVSAGAGVCVQVAQRWWTDECATPPPPPPPPVTVPLAPPAPTRAPDPELL